MKRKIETFLIWLGFDFLHLDFSFLPRQISFNDLCHSLMDFRMTSTLSGHLESNRDYFGECSPDNNIRVQNENQKYV